MAGVRVSNRILPVFRVFRDDKLRKAPECCRKGLLELVAANLPPGCNPVRDGPRVRPCFVTVPVCGGWGFHTWSEAAEHNGWSIGSRRMLLGRVRHRKGKALRYHDVAYQDEKAERLDLVVFHDPLSRSLASAGAPDSEDGLPTEEAVQLYRQRMHID